MVVVVVVGDTVVVGGSVVVGGTVVVEVVVVVVVEVVVVVVEVVVVEVVVEFRSPEIEAVALSLEQLKNKIAKQSRPLTSEDVDRHER